MRKLVLMTLATGALVVLQRRASRLGFVPALLLTAAAERGLELLNSPTGKSNPMLWRRLLRGRAVPSAKPKH
jgi:hypothetical protein